ncbi:putative LysR family transcriptional regulator [Gordonia effusa NBRC 100432]|uniref:Putative LysR family transcriptional regulator n=1 Tax=Gordonia effusa NBRC 100432 TaxID=1077974 RepID=H0R325_9ACTN|nr:LysR family transcriptional regulator [Gordonia effusa]GAB19476.1 putative LysR family transcriptional regulator [Gordonia effusa NBRC 100432]
MDLVRHLSFFVAVAEEGHFGDAASRLEMTQPPVSQGLRRLEKELGVTLIRRTSRGAELTAAGRELLPRARLLIDDASRLAGEARRLRDDSEALKWGATPQFDVGMAAHVAGRLAQHQRADHLRTAPTTQLVEQVSAGLLDLAVVESPCLTNGLPTASPVRVPRRLMVPSAHPITSAIQPTLRHLRGLAFVHPPRSHNPAGFDDLLDCLRGHGLDPNPIVVDTAAEAAAAIASGHAFGLTSQSTDLDQVPEICCLTVSPDTVALRLRVVYKSAEHREAAEVVTSSMWKLARAGR